MSPFGKKSKTRIVLKPLRLKDLNRGLRKFLLRKPRFLQRATLKKSFGVPTGFRRDFGKINTNLKHEGEGQGQGSRLELDQNSMTEAGKETMRRIEEAVFKLNEALKENRTSYWKNLKNP